MRILRKRQIQIEQASVLDLTCDQKKVAKRCTELMDQLKSLGVGRWLQVSFLAILAVSEINSFQTRHDYSYNHDVI